MKAKENSARPQSGQGLVQVLVAMAILSVMALGYAMMEHNQILQLKRSEQKYASIDLARFISASLVDKEACSALFTANTISPINPANLGGSSPPVIELTKIPASSDPNGPVAALKSSSANDLSTNLVISSIKLQDFVCSTATCTGSQSVFTANLVVSFDLTQAQGSLAPLKFPIILRTQGTASSQTPVGCAAATPPAPCAAVTDANCSLASTNSGLTVDGACANGTQGSCRYKCDNGAWTPVSNSCTVPQPAPCNATTDSNCQLTSKPSGQSATGTCVNGTTGSCTYSCNNGSWNRTTNTCALPGCSAGLQGGNCSLPAAASGQQQTGTCGAATPVGSCSYTCNSGTWGAPSNNSCSAQGCTATSLNNCQLNAANSGQSQTGSCTGGTTGSCSYTCVNGNWTAPSSNTCQSSSGCSAATVNNCSLPTASSGSVRTGTCPSGYSGSCQYTCTNGSWTTPSSNSCTAPPANCSAQNISNCQLPATPSGRSASGTCSNPQWTRGATGSCSYTCNTGTWGQPSSNSCAPILAPCTGTTLANCTLGIANSGATVAGQCVSGYTGNCSSTCNNGSWSQPSPNTCQRPPVVPGFRVWEAPGTYSFQVPRFNTLKIEVIGGGAGGQACTQPYGRSHRGGPDPTICTSGGAGGDSVVYVSSGLNLFGRGASAVYTASGGTGGTASGGSTNNNGENGGRATSCTGGGNGKSPTTTRNAAGVGGGGKGYCSLSAQFGYGGGGGGYSTITFPSMTGVQTAVDWVIKVGAGGYGVSPATSGAPGVVYIEWQ